MNNERKAFDEAIAAMSLSASEYFQEYYFYLHLVSQCKVDFNSSISAPAAVSLDKNTYTLHLNPTKVLGITETGEPWRGFCEEMPLVHRLGILKHEMSHVCLGHLIDIDNLEFEKHNYATDCALNQRIKRDHLPKGVIYPDNFPTKEKNILWNQNNEYYYSIIDLDSDENTQQNGNGKKGKGSKSGIGKGMVGDHSKWSEGEKFDPAIQRELTRQMVEKAGEATYKSIGSYPSEYLKILDNLTPKKDVKWENYFKQILASRKAEKRKTILRKNRRLPNHNWIKGITKNRILDVAVISDASGSVSDKALKALWQRILQICNTYSSPVTLVQVDVVPSDPEKLTNKTKTITRKANGGTYLSPAIQKLKEFGVRYSIIIVTTDGELSNSDIKEFQKIKVPVIWLIEPKGTIMNEMNTGNMTAIKLEEF